MFSKYPRLCRNIVVQLLLFSKKKVLQLLLHIPNCLTSWMRSPSSSLPWRLSPWFHSFGWLQGCMMWVKGGVEICIRTPRPWTAISKRRERRPRQHSPFSSKWQNTNKLHISQGPDAKNRLRHHSQHSQTTLPHDVIIWQKRPTQQILLTPPVSFQVSRKAFESLQLIKSSKLNSKTNCGNT